MKILISIITFFATLLLAYGIASFSTWEFNPANWSIEVRAFTAGFGIIFAFLEVGFIIAYHNITN